MLLFPAVAAIIRDENNRVLLQFKGEKYGWSLPSGMIEPGETPSQTLVREVQEETGLIVAPVRLVGVFGGAVYRHTYENGDQGEPTVVVFECRVTGGEFGAYTDPETQGLDYFGEDELPELVNPYDVDMLFGRNHSFFC